MSNGRRGTRMAKAWNAMPGAQLGLVGDGTQIVGASGPPGASEVGTALRCLGEYVLTAGAVPEAGDNCTITVGIGVVSDDALIIGLTAMPDPATDANFAWLYWASHPLHFLAVDGDMNSASASLRRSFDVRSMRKLTPRTSLVMLVEYEDGAGTPPIQGNFGKTRVLWAS